MAYRNILFRGKYADKQIYNAPLRNPEKIFPDKWVYGYYCPDVNDTPLGVVKHNPHIIKSGDPNEIYTGMWFAVKEDTVGQYTGISDKNKTPIFEGDIVKLQGGGGLLCFGNKEFIGVVRYDSRGGSRQTISRLYIQAINDELNEADFTPETMEVIGNIHDNPELLEV